MAEAAADRPVKVRTPFLVFVHVPKTAGTTLREVLTMNHPGPASRGLGNVFKGGGGIDKGLIASLRNDNGPDLRGVGLVRGHFPLGIREYLPRYVQKGREQRCFTFLRDPADRTLSHYYSIRDARMGSDGEDKHARSPLPADPTLDDMLEAGYIHDNLQTRMLSGDPQPFGEVDEEMLEAAKRNLREGLVFFGLAERFDESLVLAKRRLGLRSLLYKSDARVNTTRPRGNEVPAELARAAERCNRHDIELYRHATELFEQAPELGELEFELELAALRAARADGEVEPDAPVPERFGGDEEAWRMLLRARVDGMRVERERAENVIKAATERGRKAQLEEEIERLKAESSHRTKELEQEVERLEAIAGSRPKRGSRRSRRSARARPKPAAERGSAARSGSRRSAKGGNRKRRRTGQTRPRASGGSPGVNRGDGAAHG